MVAIVAGNGLGLFNTSLNISGAVWGQGVLGQSGGRFFVNASTGNLVIQVQDEQLSARGQDLQHLRTYNSKGLLNDGDKDQWRWGGEQRLVLSQDALTLTRTTGDGHETVYTKNGTRWVSQEGSGAHDSIELVGSDFVWTDGSTRQEERYAASSKLLKSRTDINGNRTDYKFDPNGRLLEVRDDASKQKLVLSYELFGGELKLRKVETYALNVDASGRAINTLGAPVKQVEYDYDSNLRLKTVTTDLTPQNTTDSKFYVTSYTYKGTTKLVETVTQSDGSSASFTYDAAERIKSVTDASGTQAFSYSANRTDVTDATGQVWSYLYYNNLQLKEVLAPAPSTGAARPSTRFFYDNEGNLTQVIDARGNAVTYEYDAQGNRRLERDALGNSVERTYDTKNQVATESRYKLEADGTKRDLQTTRYAYDEQSRLRFLISAEGRVSESRYGTATNGYGLLLRSLQYTGERYDLSTLAPTDVLTEGQLTAWLARPTLVKSQVQQTTYAYDLRGNLATRTDFATSNAAGDGVLDAAATVTEYIYSGHGELLQTIAVRGTARDQRTQLSSILYDGMGRERQTIDAGGTRTTVYDDANRKITVTTGAGLVITKSFDTRGRLVSTTQSAGTASRQTQYVYNAAGQLRMVQDAQGVQRFSFYDAAGRLQYEVDGTGAVTGYVYNANGQLKDQTRYLDRMEGTASWYDAVSNTVTKDALTVGAAGSDVVIDTNHDRLTSYDYDEAGRLKTQTDAANVVTETTYDGVSRVATTKTGDRVTRYFYDRDGRQIGVVDALGFLTESKFDAAGRLVETVRYSTRSPLASNSGAPVWVGVNNRTATGGRPFEYQVPAAYDPEGNRVVYSVQGAKPAWLNFDPVTLTLSGTPPAGLTPHEITLRAADGTGPTAKTTDVKVLITVGNSAPSWQVLPDVQVASNTSGYSLILPAATDVESSAGQLTYSVLNPTLPPGLRFRVGAAGPELYGMPTEPGTYTITMQVSDGVLSTSRSFTIQVTNKGPVWAGQENKTTWRNTLFSFTVPAAVDPEAKPLTYRVISKPSWLEFNETTRVLRGTPPTLGRAQEVVLEATDPSGETVRLAFMVDVVNREPNWSSLTNPAASLAGYAFSYQPPLATDPDGETITYSATGLPLGLVVNPQNGAITGTSNEVGSFTVVLTASDPSGGSVQRSITIQRNNAPPVYSERLGDRTIDGGTEVVIRLPGTFIDPNGDALAYGVNSKPSWLVYYPAERELRGTAPNRNDPPSPVWIVASDARGANAHRTFSITVRMVVHEDPLPPAPPPWDPGPPRSPQVAPPPGGAGKGADASIKSAAPMLLSEAPPPWRPAPSGDDLHSYQYYDGQGRLVGSVDERGFLTETVYNAHSNQQQTHRYKTRINATASDTLASAKTAAGPMLQTTTVEFDGFGRLSKRTDVDGTVLRNEYDSAGRLVREVRADGTPAQRASRTRYNVFGEITGRVGGVGDATLAANPGQGAIDAVMASHGMRYAYDSLGRQVKAIDANNNATLFYYDREGRLSHSVNAKGEVSETTYNRFGQTASTRRYAKAFAADVLVGLDGGLADTAFLDKVAVLANADVDAHKDHITLYEYDKRGLLIKQTDGEGFVTTNTYTAFGQLDKQERSIAAGKTVVTQFGYDLRGQMLAQTGDVGGLNFNARLEYDAFGRVTRSVDAAGKAVATDYLEGGRVIQVTDPLTRMRRTEYDFLGRVHKQIDALNQTTTYGYTDALRTFTVTTPEGVTVTTLKNEHGETLTVIDGRGNTTAYEYNKDGQLTKVTDALGQIVGQTTYDNSGRVSKTTDARGVHTTLEYDALNRVVKRTVDPSISASPTTPAYSGLNLVTEYKFDELGQQIKVTEGLGSPAQRVTDYTYDRKGQLSQVVIDPGGLKLSTRYSFDGLGNTVAVERGTLANPSQQVTLYEFDALGRRVKEIAAPSSVFGVGSARERNLTTEYRYDAAGRVSRVIDAHGQSTWYVYDAAGQKTHTINALGEVSQSWYDANGRVVQSRQYFTRLASTDLAGLGDVVSSVAVTPSDAFDRRSYAVYDNDGRHRYSLQASDASHWTISESRYDENGNVIETRRYDQLLPQARIDVIDSATSLGITKAEVDYELATTLRYDETDVKLQHTQRTRFAYDANNRLRFTVDGLGSVSESVYDSAGNRVSSVSYASREPTLTAFTETAINGAVNRGNTDNRVSHYAYDTAGRLRYSVQVLNANANLVSRQEYDALGRLVKSTAYKQALATPANYSVATLDTAVSGAVGTDPMNRTTAFAYDAAGRQVFTVRVLTNAERLVTKQEYNSLGQVMRTTAYETPVGALADYALATITGAVTLSARDRTTAFVHDAVGRQRFTIAADGALSETVYDALGRVRETRSFDIRLSSTTAISEAALSERRAGRTVGDGVTRGEKYSYDKTGRLLSTTDAKGYVESYEYNGLGNRESYTNKTGHKWGYTYDRVGRLTTQTAPSVLMQLDGEAAPVARSLQTRLVYDAFGNLTDRYEADNTSDVRHTEYVYDRLGRQTNIFEPGWYDPATGRVEKTGGTGSFRRETAIAYDELGNRVRTSVRTGAADTAFLHQYKTYDALGRQKYEVDALNHVTFFGYNTFSEQSDVTRFSLDVGAPPAAGWSSGALATALSSDTKARAVKMDYDNLGRKTQVTQPAAERYYYSGANAAVNPGSVTPVSAAAVTRYEFTVFGEVQRESIKLDSVGASGRWRDTWHYYDVMGRQTRSIDALGHHTARDYDALGNLRETIEYANAGAAGSRLRTVPDTPAQSADDRITAFAYDARNQQTQILRKGLRYVQRQGNGSVYAEVNNARRDATVTASMTYDGEGRLLTSTDALNNVTTTEYNALGQVSRVIEAARTTAAAGSIDNDPFLNQVSASRITNLVLNAFGQVVKQTSGPSTGGAGLTLTTRRSYDAGGHLVGSTDARNHATNYKVDYAGRVTQQTQVINTTLGNWQTESHTIERRFAYDATGRQIATLDVFLNGASLAQSGQRNVYNAFGEVEHEDRIWGAANAALSSLSSVRVASYDFDKAGHLKTRHAGDGFTQYYYDLTGQVTRQEQTETDGASVKRITETVYDVLGRAKLQRLPSFSAIRAGTVESAAITPITEQSYDRWGNVISRSQGGYVLNIDGLVSNAERRTTTYEYNHDNQVRVERLPQVEAVRADGTFYQASVSHERRYDLLGRAVQEFDTVNGGATRLRERSQQFNAAGQLVAQTDATNRKTEYAYDVHGNRVGTLKLLGTVDVHGNRVDTPSSQGTVFVDEFDENGNITRHGVLRQPGQVEYVSGSGQPSVLRTLNRYQYDAANRRVGSADVMHPMEVGGTVLWSYTKYDARNFVREQRNASNVITSSEYDVLGFKVRESDAAGNEQRWDYSVADDQNHATADYNNQDNYGLGRMRYSSFGTGSILYQYNGFGQLTSELLGGAVGGSGGNDSHSSGYAYHDNGALKSKTDEYAVGTRGPAGGMDYRITTDTATYDYTVNGERKKEVFSRESLQELQGGGLGPTGDSLYRFTTITYDALGRMATVTGDGYGSGASTGNKLHSLTYRYDELGNRRNIITSYRVAGSNDDSRNHWYTYDKEGRMLIVDGGLQQVGGQIKGGTKLSYDALGRRLTAENWVKWKLYPARDLPDEPGVIRAWHIYREERYSYNDLGYMTKIEQRINRRDGTVDYPGDNEGPVPEGDMTGQFVDAAIRGYDDRGAVTSAVLYSNIDEAGPDSVTQPVKLTTTNSSYRADGLMYEQRYFDERDSRRNSVVTNTYDAAGRLDFYTYTQGLDNTPDKYTNTYDYQYTTAFGGVKELRIEATSTLVGAVDGLTENRYDIRGNLLSQRIVGPSNVRTKTFAYDGEGHIIAKTEEVRGLGNGSGNGPVQSTGSQSVFFANGRQVASVGSGSLAGVNFSSDYTPVNAMNMGGPGSYTVSVGDTLAGIARAVYGDGALWYLVADANSISAGPDQALASTEVGKTYRIPAALASRNSASTFKPYNPSNIIGDNTPIIGLPAPGAPSCADHVGAAIQMAVVVALTAAVASATGGAGVIAAGAMAGAAGAFGGQVVGNALGTQRGFDGKAILKETWTGAFSGAASKAAQGAIDVVDAYRGATTSLTGFGSRVVGGATSMLGSALATTVMGGKNDWGDMLINLGTQIAIGGVNDLLGEPLNALDTKNFAWSNAFTSITANALNPKSGWVFYDKSRDWSSIALQAVNAFASVGINGSISKAAAALEARSAIPVPPGPSQWMRPAKTVSFMETYGPVTMPTAPDDLSAVTVDEFQLQATLDEADIGSIRTGLRMQEYQTKLASQAAIAARRATQRDSLMDVKDYDPYRAYGANIYKDLLRVQFDSAAYEAQGRAELAKDVASLEALRKSSIPGGRLYWSEEFGWTSEPAGIHRIEQRDERDRHERKRGRWGVYAPPPKTEAEMALQRITGAGPVGVILGAVAALGRWAGGGDVTDGVQDTLKVTAFADAMLDARYGSLPGQGGHEQVDRGGALRKNSVSDALGAQIKSDARALALRVAAEPGVYPIISVPDWSPNMGNPKRSPDYVRDRSHIAFPNGKPEGNSDKHGPVMGFYSDSDISPIEVRASADSAGGERIIYGHAPDHYESGNHEAVMIARYSPDAITFDTQVNVRLMDIAVAHWQRQNPYLVLYDATGAHGGITSNGVPTGTIHPETRPDKNPDWMWNQSVNMANGGLLLPDNKHPMGGEFLRYKRDDYNEVIPVDIRTEAGRSYVMEKFNSGYPVMFNQCYSTWTNYAAQAIEAAKKGGR
jgi:YD repeat-containing protein